MTAGRGRDDLGAAARSPSAAAPCHLGRLAVCAAIVLLALGGHPRPATAAPCTGDSAPAGAFWVACLTVGQSGGDVGYFVGSLGALSDTSVNSFTVESLSYSTVGDVIAIGFAANNTLRTAVADWTLHYGAGTLGFSSGTRSFSSEDNRDVWIWSLTDQPWSSGNTVTVALSKPAAPVQPEPQPDPNTAPTVTITAASTTVPPGGTVALKATATDSDGTIASYRWGARPVSRSSYSTTTGEFSTTSGAETVWTAPERAEKYYVRVRVWDNGGATAHAVVTITVDDVEPVPALPAVGLALLAFVLAASGARHRRTRAVPPTEGRKTWSWP